jgi:hypothetical protein
MAGLGRKVFTAGEVLAAADVNGYLMDQTVMVFDDLAARSSAIPSPTQGMLSYLSRPMDVLQVYGTAWADVSATLATSQESLRALRLLVAVRAAM